MYSKRASLTYKKQANMYANSTGTLTFNPETLEAHSYRWWKFVAKVDGLVVFNSYRYSVTTTKHQYRVRQLLNELGIKIDLFLTLPDGINSSSLSELIITAEEALCNKYLAEKLRAQDRYIKAKAKRIANTNNTGGTI